MLHKGYDRKGLIERKKNGHDPHKARRQDELIGGKVPFVK
jgi:hypothetical protein